jgi:hypothetical protein
MTRANIAGCRLPAQLTSNSPPWRLGLPLYRARNVAMYDLTNRRRLIFNLSQLSV